MNMKVSPDRAGVSNEVNFAIPLASVTAVAPLTLNTPLKYQSPTTVALSTPGVIVIVAVAETYLPRIISKTIEAETVCTSIGVAEASLDQPPVI